jgi:hypothetical protein
MKPENLKEEIRRLKIKFRPSAQDDPTDHLNINFKVGDLVLVPAPYKETEPKYFHGIIREIQKTGKVKVFIIEEGLTSTLWLSRIKPIEEKKQV